MKFKQLAIGIVFALILAFLSMFLYYKAYLAPVAFNSQKWKAATTEERERMSSDLWKHERDFVGLTKAQVIHIFGLEDGSEVIADSKDDFVYIYHVGRGSLCVHFGREGKSTFIEFIALD